MKTRLVLLAFFIAGGSLVMFKVVSSPPPRRPGILRAPATIEIPGVGVLDRVDLEPSISTQATDLGLSSYRLQSESHLSVEVIFNVVYLPSANADARTLPKLAISEASPRRNLPIPVKVLSDGPRQWIEFQRDGDSFQGARINPEGNCTVTKAQLWKMRLAGWAADPRHLLRWLFTSESLVDRRAIWLEMRTSERGLSLGEPANLESIWSDVMSFFASHAGAFLHS